MFKKFSHVGALGCTSHGLLRLALRLVPVGDITKNNALIGMAELFISQRLRLGYSYNHSMSNLAGYAGSTHEISLSWNF